MRLLYSTLLVFFLASACKDPVQIDFPTENSEILTVDGFISTGKGPHIVSLSLSQPFITGDITNFKIVPNAIVSIDDSQGNCHELQNLFTGKYQTGPDFTAVEGESYTLTIQNAGKVYQSEAETIPENNEIVDLRFEPGTVEFLDEGVIIEKEVVNYFVDFMPPSEGSFTIFDWTAVFEFFTPSPARNAPVVCYPLTGNVGFTRTFSTKGLSGEVIENVLLDQLGVDFRFQSALNLNAILYSVSDNAFAFYNSVINQKELTGSVFDGPPIQISGNIKNTANPEELVFGFFGAFNATEKRVFISSADLRTRPRFSPCPTTGIGFTPPFCTDCTLLAPNTPTNQPEFWQQ